ncbi:hypothetical protein VTJ04DRAFT_8408 [Mycothermus thermophilus]|uniref:uncharacterized protein n=1 Tax=Humicola insolens TaxID=85995 RepID=UPI0037433EB8
MPGKKHLGLDVEPNLEDGMFLLCNHPNCVWLLHQVILNLESRERPQLHRARCENPLLNHGARPPLQTASQELPPYPGYLIDCVISHYVSFP